MKEKERTRTQIYLTPEQHKKLRMIYAETGQRITETVRLAIEEYLCKKKESV
jgi:hypothetical protein